MRIGVIYLSNYCNSWNMSEGILNTLHTMGHEIHSARISLDGSPSESTSDWNDLDCVIAVEAEYIPISAWDFLNIPTALWFTETANRLDISFGERYQEMLNRQTNVYGFFVGLQDARNYGRVWLPHGVDTNMFRPLAITKTTDIGIFGQVYGRREAMWRLICESGIPITRIEKASGDRAASTRRLVQDINRCKMILALPSSSHSFTTRPAEVMACGVPLLVPYLPDFARCNEEQWVDGPIYYKEDNLESLKAAIETARQKNPQDILREAREHKLSIRLRIMLETMGFDRGLIYYDY